MTDSARLKLAAAKADKRRRLAVADALRAVADAWEERRCGDPRKFSEILYADAEEIDGGGPGQNVHAHIALLARERDEWRRRHERHIEAHGDGEIERLRVRVVELEAHADRIHADRVHLADDLRAARALLREVIVRPSASRRDLFGRIRELLNDPPALPADAADAIHRCDEESP